ncbi:MAG: ATP-binding protein, partial [Bacteroidales bacterium]|nr:ATP-binding protein [Bacteroidales bacterium]
YHCKNGVLLIDEISNGFHHSVMCSLWKILIDAATKKNTQIFATTHDADSIKGLRDAALGSEHQDKIASFKLLKTQDDHLEALHYSLESIDYSFNQAIEIR